MTQTEINELIAKGYRRVSNKYGMLSRIDREDWVEKLIDNLVPWRQKYIKQDGKERPEDAEKAAAVRKQIGSGMWEDHYRRCISRDTIEIPISDAKKIPRNTILNLLIREGLHTTLQDITDNTLEKIGVTRRYVRG